MLTNNTAPFQSILFARSEDRRTTTTEPPFFRDLNLDQIVNAITAGRGHYDIKPFFYASLHDADAIEYRQQIFKDLEDSALLCSLRSFSKSMEEMREHLGWANRFHYRLQRQRWFLDAAAIYCDLIINLTNQLSRFTLESKGLLSVREYLSGYIESDHFLHLLQQTHKLNVDLAAIQYCIRIKGGGFSVRKVASERNYSAEIEATFSKFQQGSVKDYRVQFTESAQMNHIEAKVLEFVARLHPEIFSSLNQYCVENTDFVEGTIAEFDREIQFYLAYLDHIQKFRCRGLEFCYPTVSDRPSELHGAEVFDLALADKLFRADGSVVPNDFRLEGAERVIVVSGPNQGGKTTFARAFGQAHYLASLGLLVPGKEARLLLFDRLFTHFEREEQSKNFRGKLQDDLLRVREILIGATSNSFLIINEIFTSTTLRDALFLGAHIMKKIVDRGSLCVWVTFVDELALFGEQVVSVVATVDPNNPSLRTFKIVRSRADGLSYAMSIAEKYGLTYRRLQERIRQ